MMEVTDDMLMALADGELDTAAASDLRARVAADPALQRRYAVFADSAAMLRAAFDPGPVPDRLIDAIMQAPGPVASPAPRGNVVPLPPARHWLRPLAIGLAAGVVTVATGLGGVSLWQGQGGGAQGGAAPGGSAVVDPSDYAGLATGTEMALPDGSRLRMLGSFETDMGLCRMASVDTTGLSERRIICRNDDVWQVALRLEAPAVEGFQPASDTLSGMADQWLDMVGAGEALEPDDETRALGQDAALP